MYIAEVTRYISARSTSNGWFIWTRKSHWTAMNLYLEDLIIVIWFPLLGRPRLVLSILARVHQFNTPQIKLDIVEMIESIVYKPLRVQRVARIRSVTDHLVSVDTSWESQVGHPDGFNPIDRYWPNLEWIEQWWKTHEWILWENTNFWTMIWSYLNQKDMFWSESIIFFKHSFAALW